MVDGQTAATLGVGIGVVLVVLDQVTPGIVFMLLGIVAFVVLEAGGGRDERGQVAGPTMPLTMFVLIVVAVVVANTILNRFLRSIKSANGPVHLCGSAGGCTGIAPDWWILATVLGGVLAASLVLRYHTNMVDTQ